MAFPDLGGWIDFSDDHEKFYRIRPDYLTFCSHNNQRQRTPKQAGAQELLHNCLLVNSVQRILLTLEIIYGEVTTSITLNLWIMLLNHKTETLGRLGSHIP